MSKDLVKKYIELARKLGKVPTRKDCRKLLGVHIEDFGQFKKQALLQAPDLEQLEVPVKITDADIEAYRLNLHNNKVSIANKKSLQKLSTLAHFDEFAKTTFSGKVKNVTLKPRNFKSKRTHTLVLSDLHIGSDIEAEETGVTDFGKTEECRRLAYIIKETIEYKKQYKANSHLEVLLVGDIINGLLHDERSGAVLSEQFARAVHLLSQAITQLALVYPTVSVRGVPGNHDRITSRHKERAVHGKYDSIAMMIHTALKYSCANLKNVVFSLPKTPLAHYDVYGKRIGFTHGDTVIKTGSVGTTISIKGIEGQINKINAALPDKEEYSVMIHGHTHTPYMVHLSNGCVVIGNGSLPSPDAFAVSIGLYESHTGMYIFESVPGFAVGDIRLIRVNKEVDKDASLEKIITPWKNF